MNIYEELGFIEAQIQTFRSELKKLNQQKSFLIKTIDNHANQSIHQESGREPGTGTKSETSGILDQPSRELQSE